MSAKLKVHLAAIKGGGAEGKIVESGKDDGVEAEGQSTALITDKSQEDE